MRERNLNILIIILLIGFILFNHLLRKIQREYEKNEILKQWIRECEEQKKQKENNEQENPEDENE